MLPLVNRALSFSTRPAIISGGKAYSYQHLVDASRQVATVLLAGQSDLKEARVAFMIKPGFAYVKVQWGIWQAGGIAVPLGLSQPPPSLGYVLDDAQVSCVVADSEYAAILKPLAAERQLPLIVLDQLSPLAPAAMPAIASSRRAMILYTSGTTGKPKGVVTTHQQIEAQITALVEAWEWEETDHILNCLPMHHVHGIINVLSCALWSGACCTFLPKFSAEAVFELFRLGHINLFMAVPTIYYKLINAWADFSEAEQGLLQQRMQAFRLMVSGSAALPVSVMNQWQEISGQILLERYGMTEMGMAISNPYRGERRPGCIGQPLPGVTVRLADEEDREVPHGEPGEIQVKGPNVFQEYWNKPTATAESFTPDGWFRTGDIAVIQDGSYKILGRNSVDIIKSGGYKLSALEIEEVLRTHPLIRDCAVVGVPDLEWGERVAASLILVGTEVPDFAALRNWLRERLPAYKVPRDFIVQEDFPRNAMGKVTKNELKPLFTTGTD